MTLISRRAVLRTGLAAAPALALGRPMAAVADVCGSAASIPTTLRQVATGCHMPDSQYPGVPSCLFRSPHFNRSGLTLNSLQIAVPNLVGLGQPSSPKTWRARIEYPLNTMTAVSWNGGNPDVTIDTSVPFVLSDEVKLTTPIPDNALFWVRLWQQDLSAATLLFQNIGNFNWNPQIGYGSGITGRTINLALGETNGPGDWPLLDNPVVQDPSQANHWAFTNGDSIAGVTNWAAARPLAILGQSRKPAFSLWGDSRVCGIGDAFDGVCDDRGEVERSIGPACAYINFALSGLPAATLAALFQQVQPANIPHFVFGRYTTNLIEDLGGADCVGYAVSKQPVDVSAILATKNILWNGWASLGRLPSSLSTLSLPPYTGYPAANVGIKTFSDKLLAGVSFQDVPVRVLDIASTVASVDSSGQYVWRCPDYAADGLHESYTGCLTIQQSGIIDPYALTH